MPGSALRMNLMGVPSILLGSDPVALSPSAG